MNRYIGADKFMKVLEEDIPITDNPIEVMTSVIAALEEQPTADVRENVKGEWRPIEVQPYFKKHFDTSVACSVCHRKGNKRWNFCPNCGAQMMRGEA